jgi:hypothetical protein
MPRTTISSSGSENLFYPLNNKVFLLIDLKIDSFASVVSRLFELGVPTQQFVTEEPWIMKTVDEQK